MPDDLATWQAQLDAYMAASLALASGTVKSYTIQASGGGGRTVTKYDLKEITDYIQFCQAQVTRLSRGGIRVRGAIPL